MIIFLFLFSSFFSIRECQQHSHPIAIQQFHPSSTSSTSSSNSSHPNTKNSLSQSSSTFLPLRSATSSFHLSKLNNNNSRSMQSLKIHQQYRTNSNLVARISPLVITQQSSTNDLAKKSDQDEGWISCEELETIEKTFY